MKHQNKRRQRTQALTEAKRRYLMDVMAEQADNAIEQHRFNKLVKSGVIVQGSSLIS